MRRKLFLLLLFCLVSCCAGELAERLGMSPEIWIGKNGRSMPYFFPWKGAICPVLPPQSCSCTGSANAEPETTNR